MYAKRDLFGVIFHQCTVVVHGINPKLLDSSEAPDTQGYLKA
jgi:hypothetical protein